MKNIFLTVIFFVLASLSLVIYFVYLNSFESAEIVNVSNTEGYSYAVQLLVDGNDIYTVWTDNTPGNSEIFFVKSLNGITHFEKPINLSLNQGDSSFPRLDVTKNNVYVTWYDYSPGQSDIFFAKSEDRGNIFQIINLSNNQQASYNPWIASSENNVYVIWNDGGESQEVDFGKGEKRIIDLIVGNMEILFARSEDEGDSFKVVNLSNTQELSWNPRIAVESNNVYVVWNEGTEKSDIFFAISTNYGASFSKPINVSNSEEESFDAGIAVDGKNVYLLWKEKISGVTDIFFAMSDNDGTSFSEPINLSNSSGQSEITRDTQIDVFDGRVFTIWYDDTDGNFDVFFSSSAEKGLTFRTPINLSNSSSKSEFAQISVQNQNVFVIWNEFSMDESEIMLRVSKDYGESFGDKINLSNDAAASNIFILGPQLVAANDGLYTIWENKTQSTSDLFLKFFR